MMSNKEFLELLNLYIDQEISSEQRERLEREISGNESRRAMFNEYVRLQDATEKLFVHFRENLAESVDLKKYHILSRNADQRFVLGSLYSAAAVLVACLSIFAATRILSDQNLTSRADVTGADEGTADVEVVRNPYQAEGNASGRFLRVLREEHLPSGSALRSIFAEAPELSVSFQLRGEARGLVSSDGVAESRPVFQSSNSFESPPPDLVSFQFQR